MRDVREVSELEVLRLVELKGRVRPEDLGPALELDPTGAGEQLDELTARGLVAAAGRGFRLSPEGKTRLVALLEADRAEVDQDALARAYDDFCGFNGDLKQIITDWQVTPAGTPNDHTDVGYDAAVIARLTTLYDGFAPLLATLGTVAGRLGGYPRRFTHALERIAAGETTWVARPIMDSFHTVWFELHEDLIQLSGRTRLEEAAAGRAH